MPALKKRTKKTDRSESSHENHRLPALLVLGLVVVVALWVALQGLQLMGRVLFLHNQAFTLKHLDLSSTGRIAPEHIREYASLETGGSLFELDLSDIRRKLESVSHIRHAEVALHLPDTLQIHVTERTPLARLNAKLGRYFLVVDREGCVLGPSLEATRLPVLAGITPPGLRPGTQLTDERFNEALEVLDLCDTTRLGELVGILQINVEEPDSMLMRLKGGESVEIGRDRVPMRMRKLAAAIQSAAEQGLQVSSYDVTGDSGVVAEFR